MLNTVVFNTSNRMLPLVKKIKNVSNIKLCVVKSDVKVGRKQQITENIVKKWCIENQIDFIQIDDLKEENIKKVIKKLDQINFDVAIVVDFNYIISDKILNRFKNKFFNIHYSLLPKYRGASPIQFAILNQDKITGITYQRVHSKMDKGNIILQYKIKNSSEYNSKDLFDKLLDLNVNTIDEFLNKIENNNYTEIIQNDIDATYTYSKTNKRNTIINKQDAFTDLTENKEKIYAKIRAFYPWPILHTKLGCFAKYNNLTLKDSMNKDLIVKLISAKLVNDNLDFKEIQIQGKQKTDFKSFVNGYCVKK